MSKMVRYEKSMRERAVRERKYLITVSVDGHHLKDGSVTVQGPADLKTAKRFHALALELFNRSRVKAEELERHG